MEILDIILTDDVLDKIIWRHNISELELRQVITISQTSGSWRKEGG